MKFPSTLVPSVFRRDGVQRTVKAVLALGALGYLIYLVEPSALASAVANAQYGYLAAAVALLPVNALLEGAAWRSILTAATPGAAWRTVYGALFCGHTLGLVTPARAGEFAGRALYFAKGDRWAIAATVFVQRLLDMLAAVGCGSAMLAWALATGLLQGVAWQGALALGLGVSLALALLLLWPRRAGRYARRLISSERVREHLGFLRRLGPVRMGSAALLVGLRYVVYVTQFVLLARAFSPAAALPVLYGGVVLVFFAKFLLPSLTLMDVGIREGAALFFLSTQLGLPQATSFNAAFLLFLTNLVLPAALGAPFLMQMRLSKTDAPSSSEAPGESAPGDGPRPSAEGAGKRETIGSPSLHH